MLKVRLSRATVRFLRGVPPKHGRQIERKLAELRTDPYPQDARPLRGSPYRRADVGEYRVIYQVEGDLLDIVLVGKRNDADVYRRLRRGHP